MLSAHIPKRLLRTKTSLVIRVTDVIPNSSNSTNNRIHVFLQPLRPFCYVLAVPASPEVAQSLSILRHIALQ